MQATKEENKLQNNGNLDEAEFLYKNWKVTDVNNSNTKVIGIGEEKGKYKYALLRRINALGNAGGGILFWGVNEKTKRVEGIKIAEKEREKITQEIRLWHDEDKERIHIKKKFLPVHQDPFNPSDVEGLYVLRIEAYPESEDEKHFALKIKKKGEVIKE